MSKHKALAAIAHDKTPEAQHLWRHDANLVSYPSLGASHSRRVHYPAVLPAETPAPGSAGAHLEGGVSVIAALHVHVPVVDVVVEEHEDDLGENAEDEDPEGEALGIDGQLNRFR